MSSLLLIVVQALQDEEFQKINSYNWELLKYFRIWKIISDE